MRRTRRSRRWRSWVSIALLLLDTTTRPRHHRCRWIPRPIPYFRQNSPFPAITSVERQALHLCVYGSYVPAPQVGGEQDVVPEGQVGRVAEQVGLLVTDQARNRSIGG